MKNALQRAVLESVDTISPVSTWSDLFSHVAIVLAVMYEARVADKKPVAEWLSDLASARDGCSLHALIEYHRAAAGERD